MTLQEKLKLIAEKGCFSAEVINLSDTEDNKEFTVSILARTPKPVHIAYVGDIVHDLSGYEMNKSITIDWQHDPDKIIGYSEKVENKSEGLVLESKIFQDLSDTAKNVVEMLKKSIPLQASITFAADVENMVYVNPDEKVIVNGSEYSDVIVIKKWKLQAVAICQLGRDDSTRVTFGGVSELNIKNIFSNIKNKQESEKYEETVSKYQKLVEDLNIRLTAQETKISKLEKLKIVGEKDPIELSSEEESKPQKSKKQQVFSALANLKNKGL